MNKLKPCPFCGGESKYCDAVETETRIIFCRDCTAVFHLALVVSKNELINSWNRRKKGAV